jgi:hypothetical protein
MKKLGTYYWPLVGCMHKPLKERRCKFDVGANFQEGGSGIRVSADFGLGENMSWVCYFLFHRFLMMI